MATLRVTCLVCEHPIELPAAEVVLHIDERGARYGFDCATCHVYVVRRASAAIVDALLATDVQVATGSLAPWERAVRPGVLVDAGSPPEGTRPRSAQPERPPLTADDLADLRRALADDHALAAWLAD